jgi:hypothetical protein
VKRRTGRGRGGNVNKMSMTSGGNEGHFPWEAQLSARWVSLRERDENQSSI